MTKAIITILLRAFNIVPMSLCCHMHDDGSQGCWPEDASSVDCDSVIQCPYGAHQSDPNDEESWACNPPPRPNS